VSDYVPVGVSFDKGSLCLSESNCGHPHRVGDLMRCLLEQTRKKTKTKDLTQRVDWTA
jgi:hypothetical protein